jgi:toxin ParE1/3/4
MAERDLAGILDYTADVWGAKQAEIYLDGLVRCFERIAELPTLGRACDTVLSGFLRIEEGKHVVFYRSDEGGVFVARVLHQQMLPIKHRLV